MHRFPLKAVTNVAPHRFDEMSFKSCARALRSGLVSSTVLGRVYLRHCGARGSGGIYSRLLNRFLGDRAMFFDHSNMAVVSTDRTNETNT